jgi:pantoate--beta-alanine ligase
LETVTDPVRLRRLVAGWRLAGAHVGFVPTMGALHEGHLSLVRLARQHADRVVASVFVNPAQFGPGEDLARYPRQPQRDAELLAGAGCDLLFLPAVETIYPPGHATFVEPAGAALGLEGERRPGHFRGVATVVTQLFHLVQPDLAVFGEKDAQQLAVVRQLVRDLHLPVEILAGPTVREPDGLAMSSRNAYLGEEDRQRATALSRALGAAERGAREGGLGIGLEAARRELAEAGIEPEYLEARDAETLERVHALEDRPVLVLVAAPVGAARLIDNVLIQPTNVR